MADPNTQQTKTSFGKIMLASGVGFIVATSVLSFISALFFIIIIAASSSETKVKENSVLVIELNSPVLEQQQDDLDLNLDFLGMSPSPMGLNKILAAIENAKEDDNIKGIFLDLTVVSASLSELVEIKNALLDFKSSGKFIIAHSSTYMHNSYYLATVADKIYITPTGTLLWKGFSTDVMFYKGLMKKLDIEPEIIRHGKFKSAVEPFLLDSMSTENELQLQTMLDNYWNRYVNEIAAARNLKVEDLNLYADNLSVNSSDKAVSLGLVDAEKFRNDVIDELKTLSGVDSTDKLNTISLSKYISSSMDMDEVYSEFDSEDKIAVIYAEGQIIDGESNDNSMGSLTISEAIRKAAKDENVKAIVFRINSPGGSALASEIILHEIELAKKLKPVVVSMGKYAASGGYYIACYADKIYAEPYTLTGSIGVFGVLFNVQKLLNNKLGIFVDVVKTNNNADFGNFTRPLSKQEYDFLQFQIEDIYDQFITHVATGRKLDKNFVDSIGQGRIWASDDALRIGLIDSIGSIDDAINSAANLANISDYSIVEYPKVNNFFDKIMEEYETRVEMKRLGQYYDIYKQVQMLGKMQGIQMLLPVDVEVY